MARNERAVMIDYTNHAGERRLRTVVPVAINFRDSDYHPGKQWILTAVDGEDGKTKEFAMKGVHAWVAGEAVPNTTATAFTHEEGTSA